MALEDLGGLTSGNLNSGNIQETNEGDGGEEQGSDSIIGQATGGESLDRNQFLEILLEQLQAQDPMDPMGNEKFVGQMSQLTSVEQISQLSKNFKDFADDMQSDRFMGLLGRKVNAVDGDGNQISGTVERVRLLDDSTRLVIGGQEVNGDQLTEIGLAGTGGSGSG